MNFIEGRLERGIVAMAGYQLNRPENTNGDARNVICGIRPEDLELCEAGNPEGVDADRKLTIWGCG
jgi:hypothetical protein